MRRVLDQIDIAVEVIFNLVWILGAVFFLLTAVWPGPLVLPGFPIRNDLLIRAVLATAALILLGLGKFRKYLQKRFMKGGSL